MINKKDVEIVRDVVPFIEFPVFLVSMTIFLFVPQNISVLSSTLIYCFLVYIEKNVGRITPTAILMFFINLLLLIFYFLKFEFVFPYTGTIFYFSLFLLNFVLLVIKKPITMFYSNGKGYKLLHWVVSIIWTAGSFLAGMFSIVLIPNISYIFVPFIIVLVCFFCYNFV